MIHVVHCWVTSQHYVYRYPLINMHVSLGRERDNLEYHTVSQLKPLYHCTGPPPPPPPPPLGKYV